MMVLDQCVPSTVEKDIAKQAMELSHRWAQFPDGRPWL
jgi:queuine/archaeosine tRNA-ribosyltransferase